MRKGHRQSPPDTLEPAESHPSASPWTFSQVSLGCLLRPCYRQGAHMAGPPHTMSCTLLALSCCFAARCSFPGFIRTLSSTQMIFPVFIFLCLSCVTRLFLSSGLYSRFRGQASAAIAACNVFVYFLYQPPEATTQ